MLCLCGQGHPPSHRSARLSVHSLTLNNLSHLVVSSLSQVIRGHYKGQQGKIIACYRRKFEIHIERLQRDKTNGQTVNIGFHPSKVRCAHTLHYQSVVWLLCIRLLLIICIPHQDTLPITCLS